MAIKTKTKTKIVRDTSIEFKLDGRTKKLNYRQLTFQTWAAAKKLGFTPHSLVMDLLQQDVVAVSVLLWLERRQRETNLAYREVRKEVEEPDVEYELIRIVIDGDVVFGPELDDDEDEDPDDGDGEDPTSGPAAGGTSS